VINSFGIVFMAGFTAANKLYGILEIAASSYGYAMSTYAGQNSGAKLYARVRKGLRSSIFIGIITACIMSGIMVVFGKWILGCFIKGTESILIGYQFLTVLAVFFPLLYILYIVRACLQGLGNTVVPMVSSIAQLVMRTGCALFLTLVVGYRGVFYGEVLAWVGAICILLIFYYRWIDCLNKKGDLAHEPYNN
jgi:Na+-driven multidrug efflux pump